MICWLSRFHCCKLNSGPSCGETPYTLYFILFWFSRATYWQRCHNYWLNLQYHRGFPSDYYVDPLQTVSKSATASLLFDFCFSLLGVAFFFSHPPLLLSVTLCFWFVVVLFLQNGFSQLESLKEKSSW